MTDKELRKLSREDLLEMLVSQSKEVERLKEEKISLIKQLKYFQGEFQKVGSLDAILIRMGYPPMNNSSSPETALDELIRQYENEESTSEFFEEPETSDSDGKQNVRKKQTKKPDKQGRLKEALDWTKMLIDRNKK